MAPYDSKLSVGEVDDTIDLRDTRVVKPPTTNGDVTTKTDDVTAKTDDVKVETGKQENQIIWSMLIRMVILHICAVYGMILTPSAKYQTLLWSVFLYIVAMLGTTAGSHRLAAHRSYKVKLPAKILLAFMQVVSNQHSIVAWARDHRVHHKYSETDADPHNAKRGFFFSHMGWMMVKKHAEVVARGREIDISDLKSDPVYAFQHRHYGKLAVVFSMVLPTLLPIYQWNETVACSLFISFFLRYILFMHGVWSVNSVAHMWGSHPYDTRLNPVENPLLSVVNLGESFHNYHHVFPHDYAVGEFPWKVNVTTMFIDLLAVCGLVYDRKKVSSQVVQRRRERTGDLAPAAHKVD